MPGLSKKEMIKKMIFAGCSKQQIEHATGMTLQIDQARSKIDIKMKPYFTAYASIEIPKDTIKFFSACRDPNSIASDLIRSNDCKEVRN